jgi:hypothetical protein
MSARDVVERLRKRRVVSEIQTKEGSIYVRGLSGKERADYYSWIEGVRDESFSRTLLSDHRLLCIALCDENGNSLFEGEADGLPIVQDWNSEDVMLAAKEVLKLSGIGKEAAESAEKKS